MTNITTGARRCETYAGMFSHQPSGLYLTLYRAYDPYSGRWLSRDPAGEQAENLIPVTIDPGVTMGTLGKIASYNSINLYGYVGDDPVNQYDPLGLNVFQFGFQFGFSGFGFGGSFGFGGAIGGGGAAFYTVAGAGLSSGLGASAGVGGAYSNAKCVSDIAGPFDAGGGSAGEFSGGYFRGSSPDGPVRGGEFYVGPGAGVTTTVQRTNTWVFPISAGTPTR